MFVNFSVEAGTIKAIKTPVALFHSRGQRHLRTVGTDVEIADVSLEPKRCPQLREPAPHGRRPQQTGLHKWWQAIPMRIRMQAI
jgi:hypothetical protein